MTAATPPPDEEILHASCVAFENRGVLITGPSGAGKSQLALQLIALGAALVADDRTLLSIERDRVIARVPAPLRGMIEARGVGLLRMTPKAQAEIVLVAELSSRDRHRLPQRRRMRLLRRPTPLISVVPDAAGASIVAALLNGAELIDPDADD